MMRQYRLGFQALVSTALGPIYFQDVLSIMVKDSFEGGSWDASGELLPTMMDSVGESGLNTLQVTLAVGIRGRLEGSNDI